MKEEDKMGFHYIGMSTIAIWVNFNIRPNCVSQSPYCINDAWIFKLLHWTNVCCLLYIRRRNNMSRRACQSPVQNFTSGLLNEPPIIATVLQYTMVLDYWVQACQLVHFYIFNSAKNPPMHSYTHQFYIECYRVIWPQCENVVTSIIDILCCKNFLNLQISCILLPARIVLWPALW